MAIFVFLIFVTFVLAISAHTSKRARSVGGYFVANSSIHWGVNGIAFAGGYLSVASFLGICGLIAFFGYDGFLYSIGFLAGWIVALFVIAEPMKRMGTFTFSDALNKNYGRPGIQLAAGLSVLVVSLFYLVPQMVGAGVLVEPLLGISYYLGVLLVGSIVIMIVAGGGMTSTTYVQFFNGGLLLTFAAVLTIAVLFRGVNITDLPTEEGTAGLASYRYEEVSVDFSGDDNQVGLPGAEIIGRHAISGRYTGKEELVFYQIARRIPAVHIEQDIYSVQIKGRNLRFINRSNRYGLEVETSGDDNFIRVKEWWRFNGETNTLVETQHTTVLADGTVFTNGFPDFPTNRLRQMGRISAIPEVYDESTGAVGPLRLLSILSDPSTEVHRPRSVSFTSDANEEVTIHYEEPVSGAVFMRPGLMFPITASEGEPKFTTLLNRLNFISLMLALFLGTAALPHILIRYYTVPSADAARKSTIVAIAGIGLFYALTMYLGVGSIASGALNPETSNMSAPLLARSFGEILFALISGIAFTTVLATVSGLIIAASGAVAHDLLGNLLKRDFSDAAKVKAGRIVAVIVGIIGIILGMAFRDMNVSFLVGWAFAVAASANLPALLCMLFWKKTTSPGIVASILVGIILSVGLILLCPDMWARYGFDPATAPMPINQPGIVSIPISFLVLIFVSMATYKETEGYSAASS